MEETKPLPSTHTGPGLVDLQVNGYAGFDFNSAPDTWSPEAFQNIRARMSKRGIVASLPTFITDDIDRIIQRCAAYRALIECDPQLAAMFPKLHIEGPFISAETGPRGAHPLEHCRNPEDVPDFLDSIVLASGNRIGILTLAPELPGAQKLIQAATSSGITVAIGHTNADRDEILAAIDAGAVMSTHLGNGSHQTLPRMDNYIQAQLSEDRLLASFIPDGHHVPYYTLKNFLRAKGINRSVLVTDAISAAELGPGTYALGDFTVNVSATLKATKAGHEGLAGAAITLDHAVINTYQNTDASWEQAWAMASTKPAAIVGLPEPECVSVRVSSEGFAAYTTLESTRAD